jgi:threonine dehydrogenase-like Zn-dependent dehydrogenase
VTIPERTVRLIATGRVRPSLLVDAISSVEQVPAALAAAKGGEVCKVVVDHRGGDGASAATAAGRP